MSEQTQEAASTIQEILAQMARMQAELEKLNRRSQNLSQIETPTSNNPPLKPGVGSTRRKTLKRLGLAILGGAAAATVTGYSAAEAKIVVKPGTSRIGAFVLSPNAVPPTGDAPGTTYQYGLVVSAPTDGTALNLTTMPIGSTGVFASGTSQGVYGAGGTGVFGKGSNFGVRGDGGSTGVGVRGDGFSSGLYGYNGGGNGVFGQSGSSTGNGVSGSGSNTGVRGEADNFGVYGVASGTANSGSHYGVYGISSTTATGGSHYGVYGYGVDSASNGYGVYGTGSWMGVYGKSLNYIGIYGEGPDAAGYFEGYVRVTGTFEAATKYFKIDHPLDPANKYLYHTSVESPDMLNLYNGLVTLDAQGEATVEMPDWFEALNRDFRYQLTALDNAGPNLHIASRLKDRQFKIGGGLAGQEVSWMVTGIRQDAYAKAHPSPVEQEKSSDKKGKYLHPELFGQPKEMSVSPRFDAPGGK